ncbi:hypothetical protein C2S51_006918 [Perilla frutescens var. frutescens]|nr:hypothetical protein C2S51_006918 [Perilla frutescens var. frutescens]
MREDRISSAAATPEFSFTLGRVAVAQICQSIGYNGAQRPALEALTDIVTRYLKAVAKLSTESANSNGRTQSNLSDIIAALEDLASVQGFEGSWRVRSRSLWRSAVIKDLMKLVKYMEQIPFAQPLPPPRRKCSERVGVLKNRDNSGWYNNEGSLKHVPQWLPAVEGGEEEEVEAEERKGDVKWECLDGGEKRGEAKLGCDEVKKLKREYNDEMEKVWAAKRGKVKFKIGEHGNRGV